MLRSIFFVCDSPRVRLVWTKVGGRLPSGRYEMNRYNSELLIKDVRKSDEGDYKCQASNSNGRDHRIVQVDVQCMSSVFPLNMYASTYCCLTLACGKFILSTAWFYNQIGKYSDHTCTHTGLVAVFKVNVGLPVAG